MNEIRVTITGNVALAPELRSVNGKSIVEFSVAHSKIRLNPTTKQWESQDPTFVRCTAWERLADNINSSIQKGSSVIIIGRLENNQYTPKEGGDKKYGQMRIVVEEIGASLKTQTVQISKTNQSGNFANNQPAQVAAPAPQNDPYAVNNTAPQVSQDDPFAVNQVNDTPVQTPESTDSSNNLPF